MGSGWPCWVVVVVVGLGGGSRRPSLTSLLERIQNGQEGMKHGRSAGAGLLVVVGSETMTGWYRQL